MITPKADTKAYREIKLMNGLKVLLISNPKTEKAAMAMNVHVGSYSDPDEYPGLAHFLEHMLFMGTKSYPDEDAYERMLEEYNGNYNAYTDDTRTVFYFDIQQNALTKILPLFAGFFTEPLMSKDAVAREMNAVHSEHEKNLQVDYWRIAELQAHLASKEHPFSKFGTGNLDTLKKPKTVEALHEFYQKHYSSDKMTLCVLGNQSLDSLQALVKEYFEKVPRRPTVELSPKVKPFKDTAKAYQVQTVRDVKQVQLIWQLSNYQEHYQCNPSSYCSSLIGYEGPHSLFSFLKPMGCLGLYAGGGTENTNFSTFEITLEVTTDCTDIESMINYCIGYVVTLAKDKQLQERYKLVSRLSKLKFDYASEGSPINLTQRLSIALEKCTGEYLTSGIPLKFDQSILEKYLMELNSLPMVFIMSQDDISDASQEPIYGTNYQQITYPYKAEFNSKIKLRSIDNPFIPRNLGLVREVPTKLHNSPVELWYCQSTQYQVPKSYISMVLFNSEFNSTAEQFLATRLYIDLLMDNLNELLYDASEAGVYVKIYSSMNYIQLQFSGFSSGLYELIKQVIKQMVTFKFTDSEFNKYLQKHLTDCKSYLMSSPYKLLLAELRRQQIPSIFSPHTMINTNTSFTYEKMQKYHQSMSQLLSKSSIRMIVYGNETTNSAIKYSNLIEKQLQLTEVAQHQKIVTKDVTSNLIIKLRNLQETNVAFGLYWHMGNRLKDFDKYIYCLLLSNVLSQPFFDSLRTKQQLGYIVFCKFFREYNNFGMGLCAQAVSENFPVNKIRSMFEEFIHKTAPSVLSKFDKK